MTNLKKEFSTFKNQASQENSELKSNLARYEEEVKKLKLDLDEEKRKNEDLEFKIEEDEIIRAESNTEDLLAKIKVLEQRLQKQDVQGMF